MPDGSLRPRTLVRDARRPDLVDRDEGLHPSTVLAPDMEYLWDELAAGTLE